VISGGDGTAAFIYTPLKTYGFYLDPSASVSGSTIALPEPLAISQLWDADRGWTLLTYYVRNDHPYLGKVGANQAFGELAWKTWNEPGSVLYKTNGMRVVWRERTTPVQPVQAYDSNGTPAFIAGVLNPEFDGNAVSLEYAAPLPTASNIGAYYVSFIGRIAIQVQDVETGLMSNTIVLQLEAPPEIKDAPDVAGYLYLNTANDIQQGRLNANRLGGAR
jgi:hypothetical protein